MDDIAVFFATSPPTSLACDGTSSSTPPSIYHNQELVAVATFATGSYPYSTLPVQQSDDKKLELAVYHTKDEQPDYIVEGVTISLCRRRSNLQKMIDVHLQQPTRSARLATARSYRHGKMYKT